jgi:hypothetical protein
MIFTKVLSMKAKRNPIPTINDVCRYHKTPYAQTHEVFYGTANRQHSIDWGMQVTLCHLCHRDVHLHPNKHKDRKLKQIFQLKFEKLYGHDKFMQIFGRNYRG